MFKIDSNFPIPEIWKDIKDYEGYYQVSNQGRVKSLKRTITKCNGVKMPVHEKILINSMSEHGYHRVSFCVNSKKIDRLVHRLVLAAFIGESKLHVNHKNGVKTDNTLKNLEYCTQLENNNHQQTVLKNRKKYGAWFHKRYKKWRATLKITGIVNSHLGMFKDKDDAHQAFYNAYLKAYGVGPWEGEYREIKKERYGITLDKRDGRWQASLQINKKLHSLGRSACKEKAYQKFYDGHVKLRGFAPW